MKFKYTKLGLLLVNFDYAWKNAINKLFNGLFFKKIKSKSDIKKLLIFRTGSIGDNICSFPAINTVRQNFPHAEIHVLTNTGAKNLVAIDKLIKPGVLDKVINYFGIEKKALFKQLKAENYDLFIEFTQVDSPLRRLLRNQIIVKLLGIPHAFGWEIAVTYFLPKIQEKQRKFLNEVDRLLAMLKKNGLTIYEKKFITGIDEQIKKDVFSSINKIQLAPKSECIGIAIGSKLERNKWPLEYFKKVVEYFIEKGYSIILFGSKDDNKPAQYLAISEKVHNFCGKLLPLASIEAMKYCSVILTNDSGPLHMAYSVKVPVVAVFSCREYPGKWYPPMDGINTVFRAENIPCAMCAFKDCPDNNNFCMKQILPEQVIPAIENVLNKVKTSE